MIATSGFLAALVESTKFVFRRESTAAPLEGLTALLHTPLLPATYV